MIIIQLSGGLGNQLNIYAFYLKMKRMGKLIKIDTYLYDNKNTFRGGSTVDRELELDKLGLEYDSCSKKEHIQYLDDSMNPLHRIKRVLKGRKNRSFDEVDIHDIFAVEDGYIYGSFNPTIYATEDILAELRQIITYSQSSDARNNEMMKKIANSNSVSVHIRRTDYLEEKNKYLNIATEQYYNAAMEYIEKRYSDVQYYIFSDDKDYIKQKYIGSKYHSIDWNTGADSIYDLQLMSMCKHNIAAKSTFSQWASRLNNNKDKVVIVPVEAGVSQYKVEKSFVWIDVNGNIVNDIR